MKNLIKTVAFIVLGSTLGYAQENIAIDAHSKYDDYAFVDARESYAKVIDDGHTSAEVLSKLGDSYYYTGDYEKASKWYYKLHEMHEKTIDPEYLYRYALSLKSTQDYTASDLIMEEFYKSKGFDYRANKFVNARGYLGDIKSRSGNFELTNMDFNSDFSDFAPTFCQGDLVFASNRSVSSFVKRIHDWNNKPFFNLYKVKDIEAEKHYGPKKIDKNINSKFHESTAVYTKDANTIYFTRNHEIVKGGAVTSRLILFRGQLNEDEEWEVQGLPFNNPDYSVAHPALSADEKTLYFASDMSGGKGSSDLYKVAINGDGFGIPVSLGDHINTEGRETFPFVGPDDKLYFASDGHTGLGGLDIFVADQKEDSFGVAHNLGEPINSPQDDFTFIIDKLGKGYFASNRDGGIGDDDIYSFKSLTPIEVKEEECRQNFSGIIRDHRNEDAIGDAGVFLLDSKNQIVDRTFSKYNGTFMFENLDCTKQYVVRYQKEDYDISEKMFLTGAEKGVLERTLYLKKEIEKNPIETKATVGADLFKILGLNRIYFDQGESYIRRDAEFELHKVISFMQMYPDFKIDVRSHTDSRSNDNFNMQLSERRAQATVDYIINNGSIDASRLQGSGFGETQLLNNCGNNVKCSKYEHQLNRRSEFIIVN